MNTHLFARTCLLLCLAFPPPLTAQPPDRAEMIQYAAESGEGTWGKAADPPASLASRELFTYALALCEAKLHPERLERLFELGARMQDRDPESRGYGNFRWSWADGTVLDFNAVEFCMQSGALLWLRHRDTMPEPAREALREMLEYAVEGCRRHRVPASYTNIALMNAENLILLGEALDKPEVAEEGQTRLDTVCLYTWRAGTHEYCSPTYYGTDLDCLVLTEAFCRSERARAQVRALLELLWTDIACNWFPGSQKLGGARSRDYDYLRGLGYLDPQMRANGWLPGDPRGGTSAIYPALANWSPPERLRELSETRFPRLVRQSWGVSPNQSRTHYMLREVTLSSSGANYGPMDLPLTVDLAGERDAVRCYFIPDGRRDPYGKKRIEAGPHKKTLHLRPFFAAAQREGDALALVVYRDRDIEENPATLESHFVMPREVDGFWTGDRRIEIEEDRPAAFPLPRGQAVVLRKGTAAVGVRVPWARGLDGTDAPVALVYDGNPHGALRLTVAHHSFWGVDAPTGNAGAALWVRIGGGLESEEAFEAWRRQFAQAEVEAEASPEQVSVSAAGTTGPLALAAGSPFTGCLTVEPPHSRAVLELDGEDLGKAILADIEPIRSFEEKRKTIAPLALRPGEGTYCEAESGLVMPTMVVGQDDDAFGTEYVWTPGEPGAKGGGEGNVTWRLDVAEAGTYYLWGRIMAPTPDDDSFFVRAFTDSAEPVGLTDWHTGTHEGWEWMPVAFGRSRAPTPLELLAGEVDLQLRVREDGTKIDRLFITADDTQKPQ